MNTIRFINATILTMDSSSPIIYGGEVFVVGNKINYVGKVRNKIEISPDEIIDCKNKILMPGFINSHCHNSMSLFRGIGGDAGFMNWWKDFMRPLESNMSDDDVYNGAMLSICEMIKNGITCSVDLYMSPKCLVKAFNDSKMRGFVGLGATGGESDIDENLLSNRLTNIGFNDLIKPIAYIYSIYSVDELAIGKVLNFAKKNDLVITIHASETLDEVGNCDKINQLTPIGLMEKMGVFDRKCLLAHCVYCDKDDVEILKNYADISIVTNPSSNLYLGSGIAPIFCFNKNKLNISIGTDGAGSNNCLDMFKEMFLTKNLQSGVLNNAKSLSNFDVLQMATINGAKALDINNLGMIKEKFLADLILIDNTLVNMQPQNDLINNLVNSCNGGNVELTMVNGEILYKDKKFRYLNTEQIIKCANLSINSLKNKIKK